MKHQGTITIETKRLILRKFNIEDATSSFLNWTSDDIMTEFLRWKTHENISVTQSLLQDWIGQYSNPNFYQWAIVVKAINEPIGTISVVELNENIGMVNIGYCIGSKWWHKGYTSEALSAIIKFFFDNIEVQRIEASHDPDNNNSGGVMRKCGMIYEGTLRKAAWNNKGIVDSCIYALLDTDYSKQK